MSTLIFLLVILALIIISSALSSLIVSVFSLNRYDLKLKAQRGNKQAKQVYPFITLESQLTVTLIISSVFVNVCLVIILAGVLNDFVSILLSAIIVILIIIASVIYAKNNALSLISSFSPPLKYLVAGLQFVARPAGKFIDNRLGEVPKIHSKEELYKIFDDHKVSEQSDIEKEQIEIVRHALNFGGKQVREVMIPRRAVVSIRAQEIIGPIVIDELHKSGHSRFPVYDDKKTENFIGTLYLHDLVSIKPTSTAKELMRTDVYYVHEEESLSRALKVFLKTNHHLLLVVNSFEEFVGVISLEDVIEQILGKQIIDEFDQHADLRAVAHSIANQEKTEREKQASEEK